MNAQQTAKLEVQNAKYDAINAAFKLARENGIAAYAIETKYGWIASERKPSLAFGKVIECQSDGRTYY